MITICGSIAFYDEMEEVASALQRMGHEVALPPAEVAGVHGEMIDVREYYAARKEDEPAQWVWERKAEAMRWHFDKIAASEAILVLNYEKKGIAGYIGANTLLEMGLAFYLGKNIYLLHPVPKMDYTEEILGMHPVVLEGELERLAKEGEGKVQINLKRD